jgi:hypothetical protein
MKQQFLFTLFTALVHSSFGSNEYDIFCSVGGARDANDCHVAIPDTDMTPQHLITNALHSCVREATQDNVDFEVSEQALARRQLRRANVIPQERLLNHNNPPAQCVECCCQSEICIMTGWCGSTYECGSMSCNSRRLEPASSSNTTEVIELVDIPALDLELSANCTKSVRALATLFGWNNKCLGSDPYSAIACSVTKYEVS